MIFVVDDDWVMAKCIARACAGYDVKIMGNAFEVMDAINEGERPDLMFLDVLLVGPDGFTLLNEMMSYEDTMRIPVVLVTSLEMEGRDLADYNVVGVLEKETMVPEDIKAYADRYA